MIDSLFHRFDIVNKLNTPHKFNISVTGVTVSFLFFFMFVASV